MKEFIKEYNEKKGRGCNDIEKVINDIIEDSLDTIRSALTELSDDVETGEYSNKEISDRITEIIRTI